MINTIKILGLLILIFLSLLASIGFGSVDIGLADIWTYGRHMLMTGTLSENSTATILWNIRLPRTLFAILCGIGLSICGVVLQTITHNDLSDPYILGVSSGASFGAVGVIIFHWLSFLGSYAQFTGAVGGAILATGLVILFTGRQSDVVRLVLLGLGLSTFFSALTMLMIYSAPHESQVRSAMFWMLGSFSGIQWSDIPVTAIVVGISFICMYLLHHDLDTLLLGESEALQLGLPVKKMQVFLVLVTSLCIAVLVAKAGVIGFIGLITPHIARLVGGVKHKPLLIFSALISALLMIWADVIARTAFSPEELPIGILTSTVGAPIFIAIIYRFRKGL